MNDITEKPAVVPVIGDVVKKFVELRDFITSETAALKEKLKPQQNAKIAIAVYLDDFLRRQKSRNFKTDHGTVFTTTKVEFSVKDKGAFIAFLIKNDLWDMVKLEPQAGEIDQYMADQLEERKKAFETKGVQPTEAELMAGLMPPGLNRRAFKQVNVRKVK